MALSGTAWHQTHAVFGELVQSILGGGPTIPNSPRRSHPYQVPCVQPRAGPFCRARCQFFCDALHNLQPAKNRPANCAAQCPPTQKKQGQPIARLPLTNATTLFQTPWPLRVAHHPRTRFVAPPIARLAVQAVSLAKAVATAHRPPAAPRERCA